MGEKTKNDFASQIGDEAVISVAEMRAADARTIAGGTPGKVLMGRAAQGIFDAVAKGDVPGFENGWNGKKTVIICGSGNNGGDGYALASILAREGFDVSLVRASEKLSEDGGYYYEKCREAGVPEIVFRGTHTDLSSFDIAVDCVLGTGFRGEPGGSAADAIDMINKAAGTMKVVSCDINSGMNGDTGEAVKAVKSDLTVSIGFYKTGLLTGKAPELIGALRNVDIGIRL
ncbi:MAG: NAD(P)H-hydrate epimerase [Eubacterium sp.]|nr:NAD(P)H-hydrate epimerase [Eubacterium sp.]